MLQAQADSIPTHDPLLVDAGSPPCIDVSLLAKGPLDLSELMRIYRLEGAFMLDTRGEWS